MAAEPSGIMLDAISHGLFSLGFSIWEDRVQIARLTTGWVGERVNAWVSGKDYQLYRQEWFGGPFLMEDESIVVIARAHRPSIFVARFEVAFEERTLALNPRSMFNRAFQIWEGSTAIGEICPKHFLTRRSTIDLLGSIPTPVQVFAYWLAVLRWLRNRGRDWRLLLTSKADARHYPRPEPTVPPRLFASQNRFLHWLTNCGQWKSKNCFPNPDSYSKRHITACDCSLAN